MALGENPLELWKLRRTETKAGLAKMILETEKTGILENIKYSGMIEGDILEVTFFKHPGDEIRIFENSNDCVGQIIVQGNNMGECEKNAESVISKIEMTLKK